MMSRRGLQLCQTQRVGVDGRRPTKLTHSAAVPETHVHPVFSWGQFYFLPVEPHGSSVKLPAGVTGDTCSTKLSSREKPYSSFNEEISLSSDKTIHAAATSLQVASYVSHD